jgi:tRNA-dihydrouridine synthase
VSVKTRLGYDRNIVEDWIPALLEERPVVISLHGRTLQQGYKGAADWSAIARAVELAARSETMIIGNGDARNLEDAYNRVSFSGAAGVLLGRAAQGNPWIFMSKDHIKNGLRPTPENPDASAPALAERFQVMIEHCEHFEKHAGARNFVAMRKHLTWYCRNFRGAAELRSRMTRVTSAREVAECLTTFFLVAAGDTGSRVGIHGPTPAYRLPDRCFGL